jgi:hypothetical protein
MQVALVLYCIFGLGHAAYPEGVPPKECPLYFFTMPIDNACSIRCEGGTFSKETIPCLGNLQWNKIKQLNDVCTCPAPKQAWSCHMPRRDVCIYPAQNSEECKMQARGFDFAWECRSTSENFTEQSFEQPRTEYPSKMWYCNTNVIPSNPKKAQEEGIWFPTVGQQLSTWSGVSCLDNQDPILHYPPVPEGFVMVGDYSFLRLWSYDNYKQWVSFIFVMVMCCIGCCSVMCKLLNDEFHCVPVEK